MRRAADGAAGRCVTVVIEPAGSVHIQADKHRLDQVVVNLVDNAEQHGHGVCEVAVSHAHGRITISVDDAGPGVPADLQRRIFERFARSGADPGTGVGLGLAIVERHVRRLGGTVRVRDRPGGGARFVVDLPA